MASNTASSSNDQLVIFIRFNSQHAFPVEVNRSGLIHNIQNEIAKRHDIPLDDIKIIFQGKILENDSSIQDYDLGHQTVLHAVRRRQAGDRGSSGNNSPSTSKANGSEGKSISGLNAISELATDLEKTPEKPRQQFFVYCKTCRDILPGKLRVCCSSCKQGTLVLERDPGRWSDVQGSGKIRGSCHTEGCSGQIAEFYFKCASHFTTGDEIDRSVGLELVKSNTQGLLCATCLEESNPIIVFPCDNDHVMCLECFHMYAATKLNDRAFVHSEEIGYTLTCPDGCDNSLIEDAHHFRILGQDQYERYQRFGTEEFVLQAGGVLCPRPGCGAGILPDQGERRLACLQGCGYVFCRDCLDAYHEGICASNGALDLDSQGFNLSRMNAQQARYERQSHKTIEETTNPCPNPNCKIPVERNGGCMHMVCVRCKFEWCWLCKKEWNRDCQADHWFE